MVTFELNNATFDFNIDVDYWDHWLHSGKPYFHQGAPVFFDMNNDNKLDYFNPMHGHPPYLNDFETRMELGIGSLQEDDKYIIRQYSQRIICTDTNCNEQSIDMHGSVVMDLNGDGILDIYVSNGGGFFASTAEFSTNYDNWLFWGENEIDIETGEAITVFKGKQNYKIESLSYNIRIIFE